MLDKAPNKKLSDLLDKFRRGLAAGDIDTAVDFSRTIATGAISSLSPGTSRPWRAATRSATC